VVILKNFEASVDVVFSILQKPPLHLGFRYFPRRYVL